MLIHEFLGKLISCCPQNHVLQSDNGLSNGQAQRLTRSQLSVKKFLILSLIKDFLNHFRNPIRKTRSAMV